MYFLLVKDFSKLDQQFRRHLQPNSQTLPLYNVSVVSIEIDEDRKKSRIRNDKISLVKTIILHGRHNELWSHHVDVIYKWMKRARINYSLDYLYLRLTFKIDCLRTSVGNSNLIVLFSSLQLMNTICNSEHWFCEN